MNDKKDKKPAVIKVSTLLFAITMMIAGGTVKTIHDDWVDELLLKSTIAHQYEFIDSPQTNN